MNNIKEGVEEKVLYEWVKPSVPDNFPESFVNEIFRDAETKAILSDGVYHYTFNYTFRKVNPNFHGRKNEYALEEVEWLKPVAVGKEGVEKDWQAILNIMFIAHHEFLPNSPADHETSELYMIMSKRIEKYFGVEKGEEEIEKAAENYKNTVLAQYNERYKQAGYKDFIAGAKWMEENFQNKSVPKDKKPTPLIPGDDLKYFSKNKKGR